MAQYWILKSEPSAYSFAHLERDGRTVWDGVRNPQALGYLRQMQPGDPAMVYHSTDGKAIVGLARVATAPYPDPRAKDPKVVVVDLVPEQPLPTPVSLAAIKADAGFADLALVRQPRLSVVPVSPAHWKKLCTMGGL